MISLKAGGVGLNLTHANHCFIIDPWYIIYFFKYLIVKYYLLYLILGGTLL